MALYLGKDKIAGFSTDSRIGDTLPVGAIIDYDGDEVPANWELVEDALEAGAVIINYDDDSTTIYEKVKNSFEIYSGVGSKVILKNPIYLYINEDKKDLRLLTLSEFRYIYGDGDNYLNLIFTALLANIDIKLQGAGVRVDLSAKTAAILNVADKDLIECEDSLSSTDTDVALSANQGRILNNRLTVLENAEPVGAVILRHHDSDAEKIEKILGVLTSSEELGDYVLTSPLYYEYMDYGNQPMHIYMPAVNVAYLEEQDYLGVAFDTGDMGGMGYSVSVVFPSRGGSTLISDYVQKRTSYEDSLNSTSTSKALTANQGKILNEKITTVETNAATKAELTNNDLFVIKGLTTYFEEGTSDYTFTAEHFDAILADFDGKVGFILNNAGHKILGYAVTYWGDVIQVVCQVPYGYPDTYRQILFIWSDSSSQHHVIASNISGSWQTSRYRYVLEPDTTTPEKP